MCQEIGHTLGLDHQDENFNDANLGTCMDYTSNPESNQHPNAHDYEQLESIYAHLDSTTTVNQSTATAAQPGSWGRLLATSHGGRTSVFRADLGAGEAIVTFVIWAR